MDSKKINRERERGGGGEKKRQKSDFAWKPHKSISDLC